MNLHANARTTPHTRLLLCQRVLNEGLSVSSVARGLGISRSTAAALAVLCRRGVAPDDAADRLRRAAPEATPNRHVVALADDALRLDGRLVAAAERIGRGREAAVGRAFELVARR